MLGSKALNESLKIALNPSKEYIEYKDYTFSIGDKLMQIVNDYNIKDEDGELGVFNGDSGRVCEIDKENETLKVKFDDGRIVKYDKKNLANLSYSYAITVHKSQGSEFDYCIIPCENTSVLLLNRNLIYTAITRAKKFVCLVGKREILKRMIDNNHEERRNSSLAYRIKKKYKMTKGLYMINKYFFIGDDECQICKINKRLRGKKICNSCLKSLQIYNYYGKYEDLEEVLVACYYNDFIKAVVARYKFQKETYLYNIFSDLMYDCLIQNIDPSLFTYIIPIPCSKKTLRERGFNCAGLLAEALAAKLNIPYLNPLIKDHTLEQNKIELRERTKNLKGKIRLNKSFSEDLREKEYF